MEVSLEPQVVVGVDQLCSTSQPSAVSHLLRTETTQRKKTPVLHTVRQCILQRLRPVRAEYDPIIRMQPSPPRIIALHTPYIPTVQIPSQIADLLVHEAYNRT